MNKLKHISCATLVLIFLCSCSSNEKIITKDKSADYLSAKSSPPLRKTSSQPTAVESVQAKPSSVSEIEETEESVDMKVAQGLLVEGDDGLYLLYEQSSHNEVWAVITKKIRNTDITIYHRNKTAGEFSVGCNDLGVMNDEAGNGSEGNKQSSRKWLVLKKDEEETDYCSIRLNSEKSNTTVTAYNRFGQQINSSAVKQIFKNLI